MLSDICGNTPVKKSKEESNTWTSTQSTQQQATVPVSTAQRPTRRPIKVLNRQAYHSDRSCGSDEIEVWYQLLREVIEEERKYASRCRWTDIYGKVHNGDFIWMDYFVEIKL